MSELFVGLISGTSMDSVDAALVDFAQARPQLLAHRAHPWPEDIRQRLHALAIGERDSLDEMGELDALIAEVFAQASLELMHTAGVDPAQITAIGSHGQTVRHRPEAHPPFTLQIGDANRVAELTGITTVADFRGRDMAAGGQGAPLVPAFHQAVFREEGSTRVALNIGGIANITLLPGRPDAPVIGFDTGPGNCLMDHWIRRQLGRPFDEAGAWAATGSALPLLLDRLLDDPYFRQPFPKSTGIEYFTPDWLDLRLSDEDSPEDVQASLCELTALSVAEAIRHTGPDTGTVIVCGGGARNPQLLGRLAAQLPGVAVAPSDEFGIPADWVEAMAFAWLARERLAGRPGNLPSVTGARHPCVLGNIHPGAFGEA